MGLFKLFEYSKGTDVTMGTPSYTIRIANDLQYAAISLVYVI
jgi:hypothetical protein